MLHPASSERGAHGTQLKMAVSVHHARFKYKLYALFIDTTDSVAFFNNPEASHGHCMSKTKLNFRAPYLYRINLVHIK